MAREEAISTIKELMKACVPYSKYFVVGDMAIKALEALDEIRTKITEMRDLWAENDYYDAADILTEVLRIVEEYSGG